jgi:hypothetical protein
VDFPTGADYPSGSIPDGEIYDGFIWDEEANAWKRYCEPDGCITKDLIYQGDNQAPNEGNFTVVAEDDKQTVVAVKGDISETLEAGDQIRIDDYYYNIITVQYEEAEDATLVHFEPALEATGIGNEFEFSNCPQEGLRYVYYGDEYPDNQKVPEGALFTDEDTLKLYVNDGTYWVEHANCTGKGTEQSSSKSWVYITEMRNLRQYSGFGDDSYVAKVILWDFHAEDEFQNVITQHWEIDENNDGNWREWDVESDPNVQAWLGSWYFYYKYSPEQWNNLSPVNPNHPYPCAGIRVRLKNTANDGTFTYSEYAELFLGKEFNLAMYPGTTPIPPSSC